MVGTKQEAFEGEREAERQRVEGHEATQSRMHTPRCSETGMLGDGMPRLELACEVARVDERGSVAC